MSREWKPGDVAMVTAANRHTEYRAFFDGNTWRECDAAAFCVGVPTSRRPLVVIDPEDRAAIERLRDEYDRQVIVQNGDPDPRAVTPGARGNAMQAALRSLVADPKPPEPTGLGAVVEDAEGERWLRWEIVGRHPKSWTVAGSVRPNRGYAEIAAVKVLSEGVPA